MGSLGKLPPEVARELRRHLPPLPLKSASAATSNPSAAARLLKQGQNDQHQRPGKGWMAVGCVVFTASAFSIPFFAQQWIGNLNARDDKLTHAQIRRGAFMNSGSTDAGKDPAWDFRTGTYNKDDNYWAIFDGDGPGGSSGNKSKRTDNDNSNDNNKQAFGALSSIGGGGNKGMAAPKPKDIVKE